jgi:shikimate kinase
LSHGTEAVGSQGIANPLAVGLSLAFRYLLSKSGRPDITQGASNTMKVLLTGVACVGKSTIGAELASLLGLPFFDLDTEVEAFYGASIPRLQARWLTMNNYRRKACQVLKDLLSRPNTPQCVIALPASGLRPPYWNVVKDSGSTVVVLRDDPANILNRIVFFDDDSRPIRKELTPDEREFYFDDIKKDMRYYARSYSKADVSVDINGLGPVDAAKQIKASLDALR